MMNVREIVLDHLKKIGADGLCDEAGCGCPLDDLMYCGGEYMGDCIPAWRGKCPEPTEEGCEVKDGDPCRYLQPDGMCAELLWPEENPE